VNKNIIFLALKNFIKNLYNSEKIINIRILKIAIMKIYLYKIIQINIIISILLQSNLIFLYIKKFIKENNFLF